MLLLECSWAAPGVLLPSGQQKEQVGVTKEQIGVTKEQIGVTEEQVGVTKESSLGNGFESVVTPHPLVRTQSPGAQ